MEYENGKPVRVNTVVLSTQHDEDADPLTLRQDMIERVIKPCIPAEMLDAETKYYINPTGRFVLGGPAADTGLTGRKIIVDMPGTAAAPSAARTPPRWTVPRPIWQEILPRP